MFLFFKKCSINKKSALFLEQFSKLKKSIEEEDVDGMKEMMILSTIRRKYFDK